MSFIELKGIENAREPEVAPEGEYSLCIINAKVQEKEGKTNIMNVLEIEGEPEMGNVFHYVSIPGPDDEDDKVKAKMLFARRFFTQFGIDVDGGVDTEQFVGSRALCKLTQEEYPEGSGQLKNVLQVNRLPQEED